MTSKLFAGCVGATLAVTAAACETRVPVPAGGPAGAPRVGWVIMVGDRDNPDREFVCQSDPRTDCVIPASRGDSQAFSDVHFYFHPAATDTKYSGKIQVGFFEGATPHELTPNVTVKRGDSRANTSVVGIVSSQPGAHDMTIAMVAESGTPREIRDRIRIDVK